MFLYELALQLGERSTDLVERAKAQGMAVEPSTFLNEQQIAALRGTAPQVPPPPPPPAAPDGWGSPAAPVPPAGPARTGGPLSRVTPPPTPPGWGPPGVVGPGAGGPPPSGWAPPVGPPTGMPGAGPAPWGPPGAVQPNPWGATPMGPRPPHKPPRSPVGPVLLVIGLIAVLGGLAFFFVGSSSDDDDNETSTEALSAPDDLDSTTPYTPPDEDRQAQVDDIATGVSDAFTFCEGARGILPLETSMMQAGLDQDVDAIMASIRDNSEGWEEAVGLLADGSTGTLREDVNTYATYYRQLFTAFDQAASGSTDQLDKMQDTLSDLALTGGRINAAVAKVCN